MKTGLAPLLSGEGASSNEVDSKVIPDGARNESCSEAEGVRLFDVVSQGDIGGIAVAICFNVWVLLMFFAPVLYMQGHDTSIGFYSVQYLIGLLCYILVMVYRIAKPAAFARVSSRRMLGWGILGTLGTLLVVASYMVPYGAVFIGALCAAMVVAGISTALTMVQWMMQYATHGSSRAVWEWPVVMVASGIITGVLLLLPLVAMVSIAALLPLASSLFAARFARVFEMSSECAGEEEGLSDDSSHASLPGQLVFGIVAMAGISGLTQRFSLEYAGISSAIVVSGVLSTLFIGIALLLYALVTKKNFGLSQLTLAIVPLAGLAQCMIAVFQTAYLPLSFFFMRSAFLAFDAMLWMQFPPVFEHLRSVELFLRSRVILECSVLCGSLAQMLLALTGFTFFSVVSLLCIVLLLGALTLAFASDGAGSIWNLMTVRPRSSGKFRNACKAIEQTYRLTQRESEIMRLVLRGRSGPFIEEKLVISKNTYQTHMRNIYAKVGVHSLQDLLTLLEETIEEQREKE